MRLKTFIRGALVGALGLCATAGVASAATFADTYIGGDPTGSGFIGADVIGDSNFQTHSMDVQRINNTLRVVINTNYSDKPASTVLGYLGTNIGSLFIGDTAKLDITDQNTDDYVSDKDRFSWVFDFDTNPVAGVQGQGGSGSLYAIDDSKVVLSHASGIFRANQAVGYNQGAQATLASGRWQVGVGTVTFTIQDFFTSVAVPSSLTLAWAMSCANDVILAQVPLSSIPNVPLPAGGLLLLTGLLGVGFLGRLKTKKAAA